MYSKEKFLSCFPEEWLSWPRHVEVAFTLTPGFCVYGRLYDEYAASDLEGLASKLFEGLRDEVYVRYRVRAEGFVPAHSIYSVSPLLRKSSAGSYEPRSRICVGAPWEFDPGDTILEIWARPPLRSGGRAVIMLSAGGRDEAAADINWHKCAGAFKYYMSEWKKSSPAG